MLNHDENRVLNGLLLFMLLFMLSTTYAADEPPPAPAETRAGETADETGRSIEKLLSSSADDWRLEPSGAVIIPVVAILSVFGGPVIAVLGVALALVWYHHRRRKLMHDTINRMVDKGMEIPPHISSAFSDPKLGSHTAMRRGLLLSGLGIGVIVFFIVVGAGVAAGLGAIPLFIGLGYLLIWYLESRHSGKTDGA